MYLLHLPTHKGPEFEFHILSESFITALLLIPFLYYMVYRPEAAVKQYLGSILSNIPDAVIVSNINGKIKSWNTAAVSFFGYSEEEAVGESIRLIIPKRFHAAHESGFRQFHKSGKLKLSHPVILHAETKTGADIEVEVTFCTWKSVSGEIMVTGIFRDVSTIRAAEHARDAFLANMSHEIRTPLTAILGLGEIFDREGLTGEQLRDLKTINTSGEHLLALINDVLDISKMKAGKFTLSITSFSLSSLIRSCHSLMLPMAKKKALKLEYSLDSDLPAFVLGDMNRLRQIVNNLISNAIKFTLKGKITIDVQAISGNQVRFAVWDTGIGIPEDFLPKLFSPFEQEDNSNTRKYGGTGLGLAVCKNLVELMGGALEVESNVGEGSMFYFILKMFEGSASGEELVTENEANVSKYKIIVAEDDLVNQQVIGSLLESIGVDEFKMVDNGQALLHAMNNGRFDCVLLDVQMPVMDGYTTTKKLREMGQEIPIIALTAHTNAEAKEKCLGAGMDDLLTKPLKGNDLKRMLIKWQVRQNS